MKLVANTRFPSMGVHIGEKGSVTIDLSIRVICLEDYYGSDCFTFCIPRDDDQNGHFICSADNGSLSCLEGFQNTKNNCMYKGDSKLFHIIVGPFMLMCSTIILLTHLSTGTSSCLIGYTVLGVLLVLSVTLNIAVLFAVILWWKLCSHKSVAHTKPPPVSYTHLTLPTIYSV